VANDGHQIAVAACFRPENAEAILGRSTRPARISWVDKCGCGFMRIA
jgi:hypothetical protein